MAIAIIIDIIGSVITIAGSALVFVIILNSIYDFISSRWSSHHAKTKKASSQEA